nr:crotonase/enoyl-CoA hydratase family protein [Allobranchiibius sp. GilTou38]
MEADEGLDGSGRQAQGEDGVNPTYETIRYEVADSIATVTLDRPDALNAFTVTMANELIDVFGRAGRDDEARAVIVTGAGRAFCAGMDLSVGGNVFGLDGSMSPTPADLVERFEDPAVVDGVRDTGGRVALAIYDCPKPVIAAINGAAVGVGATMTCAMDFRLASTKARIGFVFGRIGIVPEACSTWFLPRIVGIQQALEWAYSADILTAQEAQDGGLVRSVHEPDELLAAAKALAHRFTDDRSPVAVALTRQMMYRNAATSHPREAHRAESLAMFWTSEGDGQEGVASFLEKRAPRFAGSASDLPDVFPTD